MNTWQKKKTTIEALDWLNANGWDDRKIAKSIYSVNNKKGKQQIEAVRHVSGCMLRDKTFNKLMMLVTIVQSSQRMTQAFQIEEERPSLWQRFTGWLRSLLS
ncbi:MAG: hypothetical protein ACO24B_01425 [Ilumatobacteraceae bacterium]